MNGEAADEVVRIMLNGTEVALRLTGSAAKNLGVILYEWAKNNPKVTGKTSMMKLLRSGDELQVVTLTRDQYDQFKETSAVCALCQQGEERRYGGGCHLLPEPCDRQPYLRGHRLRQADAGGGRTVKKRKYSVEAKLKRLKGQAASQAVRPKQPDGGSEQQR